MEIKIEVAIREMVEYLNKITDGEIGVSTIEDEHSRRTIITGTADDNKTYEHIQNLACAWLIDADGHPRYVPMTVLHSFGYKVVAGEVDSFGWLTGVILTEKGGVVYG